MKVLLGIATCLVLAVTCLASDASRDALLLARSMAPRLNQQVDLYLHADAAEKLRRLDELEALLAEFEEKDTAHTWKAWILNDRLMCLMRRAKVASIVGDKEGLKKAAADSQKRFQSSGEKLGPRWFIDGSFNSQLMVDIANDEDFRIAEELKKANQSLEPTAATVTPRADARAAPFPTVAHL